MFLEVERFDFALVNEKSTRRLLQKDAVFEGSGEMLFDDVAKTKEKPEVPHFLCLTPSQHLFAVHSFVRSTNSIGVIHKTAGASH